MFYYSFFRIRGREILANVLEVEDPFALSPHDIVERVLALGYKPDLRHVQSQRFGVTGHNVFDVVRDGQVFVIAVSRDAEEISMQEARSHRYDVVE